jgi:16S rRNA (cytosine967-C5)-methyltransferase
VLDADARLAAAVADGGRLRALVLELWQRTRMDWGFVTDRLAQTFRKEKWIGAHERRFVGETIYGMVRNLRRIDLGLERARRTKQAPRDLERLLALLVLERSIAPARAAQVAADVDWAVVAAIDDVIAAERDVTTRIALACSLPDWLARRLVDDWGSDAEPLARALNERAPMTVRANTLVGDRDALAQTLLPLATHAGTWSDTALVVDTRTNLFALDAFQRGAFEAQDEGSQLLAELATPATAKPLVIDYCAGAGGKTLAIAARLGNRGRIVATDIDAGKLEELRRRARRAKVSNARALLTDDRELDALRGKADVVLLDAPCTGTGALRRNPEARWRLRDDDVAGFAARQLAIVAAAKPLLAPGGQLVYATCSVFAAENAAVASAIAAAHADLVPLPVREVIGTERANALGDGDALVVSPHRHGTDGFYARVFQRA